MCPFLNPPPSRSHPSFPVPKANSSHPLLCENLSVSFLPIHHTTYYVPHLDLHQTSHVQLHNPSHSALVSPLADDVVKQQYPKMCVSSRGWRARPCLLPILMAKFKQEPFFSHLIPRPWLRSEVKGGWPGYQGRLGQQGKATGAHWTVQTADLLSLTGLRAEEPGQIALSQSHKAWGVMSDRLCRASNNTLIQSQDEVKRETVTAMAFVIVISNNFCNGPSTKHCIT